MARLGAKVSRSEVLSNLKNTISVEIFWWNRPHTSFLGLIGYMVRSGAKLIRMKTLLNFDSKALSSSFFFSKTHVFGLTFCTKSHLTYFLGQTDYMARLETKVSQSEVSSIQKNTFSVGFFWWNRPHTSFLGLIGYMVRSGAKLFQTKTLLNFDSKALSSSFFSKKHVFGLTFCTKSHLTYFLGQTDYMARLGTKVSQSEVSSILKNTFSVGILWRNRPHTSFLGLSGYMVRSGAKLFRTKTLLNFASKALSNSFFHKKRFRFEFLF